MSKLEVKGRFTVEIRRATGDTEILEFDNVVTNEGKVYLLKAGISNQSSAITTWYIGLIGADVTPSVNDTASTALGTGGSYNEVTAYDGSRRQFFCAYTSSPTHQVNNYNSIAEFYINGTATAYGAFIVSTSTKGSNTGILLAAGRFGSAKALANGDTIAIKYAITV